MKKILLALVFAVQSLIGAEAIAAPCMLDSLDNYVTLGSAGCTIDGFRFSNFMKLGTPFGSTPFPQVNVMPVTVGTSAVGLDFIVNIGAFGDVFLDNAIGYRVTGTGASVNGASLFITGSSTTGDGTVTGIENLCLAGVFTGVDGVSGCSGTAKDLLVINGGGSLIPLDSAAFASVASLAVVTDIGVDGTGGTASLTSASNRFLVAPAVVPEPASVLLMVAGLLALLGYRAARLRASGLL